MLADDRLAYRLNEWSECLVERLVLLILTRYRGWEINHILCLITVLTYSKIIKKTLCHSDALVLFCVINSAKPFLYSGAQQHEYLTCLDRVYLLLKCYITLFIIALFVIFLVEMFYMIYDLILVLLFLHYLFYIINIFICIFCI